MPSWKALSDTDIAAVITYTKNNWSNKTGQSCSLLKCRLCASNASATQFKQ